MTQKGGKLMMSIGMAKPIIIDGRTISIRGRRCRCFVHLLCFFALLHIAAAGQCASRIAGSSKLQAKNVTTSAK